MPQRARIVAAPSQKKSGVTDGARTRDNQDHNLGLYQLSYGHHRAAKSTGSEESIPDAEADLP